MRRGTVFIDRARLYARHGVMEQERTVGAWFTVSVWIDCDMERAVEHDLLDGTVSYADVYNIIRSEMSTPSQLLEHVAGRIARRVLDTNACAGSVRVVIVKENPPMGAAVNGAGVDITFGRE